MGLSIQVGDPVVQRFRGMACIRVPVTISDGEQTVSQTTISHAVHAEHPDAYALLVQGLREGAKAAMVEARARVALEGRLARLKADIERAILD